MSWMSPLDGPDDELALLGRTGSGQQRAEDEHPRLHGVRGQEHLGHEENAVAKVLADDPHTFHEASVRTLYGAQPRSRRMLVPSSISSLRPS